MTIRRAILHPDSLRPLGKGRTGALLGTVRVGNQDISALIKLISIDEICAEVFCARLADGLGFTIPEPLLVHTPDGLAFGSALLPYPSFFDTLPEAPEDPERQQAWLHLAATMLSEWKKHGLLIAFDEWVENSDRNLGNLLMLPDGFAPIDHANCFGMGPDPGHNKIALLFVQCAQAVSSAAESAAIASCLTIPPDFGHAEKGEIGDNTEMSASVSILYSRLTESRSGLANRIAARFPRTGQLAL